MWTEQQQRRQRLRKRHLKLKWICVALNFITLIPSRSIRQCWQRTGGHFVCVCVNRLNDNSVGASYLMAGNRKLARKVTVFLKAISLVLWILYFPAKNILHDKNQTFLRGFPLVDFSAVGILSLLKTFKTQHQKVMFLYKSNFHWQSNAFLWFDFQTRGFTYQGGNAP